MAVPWVSEVTDPPSPVRRPTGGAVATVVLGPAAAMPRGATAGSCNVKVGEAGRQGSGGARAHLERGRSSRRLRSQRCRWQCCRRSTRRWIRRPGPNCFPPGRSAAGARVRPCTLRVDLRVPHIQLHMRSTRIAHLPRELAAFGSIESGNKRMDRIRDPAPALAVRKHVERASRDAEEHYRCL